MYVSKLNLLFYVAARSGCLLLETDLVRQAGDRHQLNEIVVVPKSRFGIRLDQLIGSIVVRVVDDLTNECECPIIPVSGLPFNRSVLIKECPQRDRNCPVEGRRKRARKEPDDFDCLLSD